MVMKITKYIFLSLILFITGCTAGGPAFSSVENPDTDKSLIVRGRLNITPVDIASPIIL